MNDTMDIYQPNRNCPCIRCRMQGMTVPALLVTLGVTLLLEHLHAARGSMIFPLLLIVFGAVRLIQHSASTEGHRPPRVSVPAAPPPPPPPAATQSSSNYEEVNRG
jgi:hypothetical protein